MGDLLATVVQLLIDNSGGSPESSGGSPESIFLYSVVNYCQGFIS